MSRVIWQQQLITLEACPRGLHLITHPVVAALQAELSRIQRGLLHLFIQHTSASLAINENADPDVRIDIEAWLNQAMRENERWYTHTLEGSDDMPAHIKSLVLGPDLMIPVSDGRLALGTWQGIYLGEHRNHGGRRHILATLQGLAVISD
ncbi:MAG: secondary thiamine-phosphate synthase enzyme YjbQ [Leptospiraceae bacterium]|nr:secondary thiamine-phosphate synthase enzyme YjbQ [Leptospiraceae bacterium]